MLEKFLSNRLTKLIRRKWNAAWAAEHPPHFTNHRDILFLLSHEPASIGLLPYYRAFFSAQMVRSGDKVLDIGCGDGFIASRCLAPNASRVDAIDIEATAIAYAKANNARDNVSFRQLDAVADPFPDSAYDVIVWDGAVGHFSAETNATMFAKIKAHLAPNGVFCGSETFGTEGHDHLQRWSTLDEVRTMLSPHFAHVSLWSAKHNIDPTFQRHEFYWRCSSNENRLRTWS